MNYFVHDPEGNVSFYETEPEARARAKALLNEERDLAGESEGWHDNIESLCWGKVMGSAKITERAPTPDGFDEMWEVDLVDHD